MERIVRSLAALSEGEAALVVQIAKTQAHVLGDTENYVVTREFRRIASREQRAQLLAVPLRGRRRRRHDLGRSRASVIAAIAEELGFTRAEANALRAEYRDKLSELQRLPRSAADEQQRARVERRRAARSGPGSRGP